VRLIMIRHAAAQAREEEPDDRSRSLTDEGARKFERVAAGLARLLDPPVAILSSPLVRARQTAEIASSAWGGAAIREIEALARGDADAVEAAAATWGEKATVALVGHEPFMSEHLARLLGAAHPGCLGFKKGGVAVVDIVPGGRPRNALLVAFLPPRVCRSAAAASDADE
jgi:phosphohistidine phosphatase